MSNIVYKLKCNDCGEIIYLREGFIQEESSELPNDWVEIYYCPKCYHFEQFVSSELTYICPNCGFGLIQDFPEDKYVCYSCDKDFFEKDFSHKKACCSICQTKMVEVYFEPIDEDNVENYKSVRYIKQNGKLERMLIDYKLTCHKCGSNKYEITIAGSWNPTSDIAIFN